jgi:hypothetical protein
MTLPIERVREILGSQADGMTDEQIAALAENLDTAATRFFEDVQAAHKRDPESVRWAIHAHETGESQNENVENWLDAIEADPEKAHWLQHSQETGEQE